MLGAGGAGGLLAVHKNGAAFLPAYDANGNITEYIAADGAITAHREYSAFGETVAQTGQPENFTFWWSTKPWCGVTGLSEYELRKYKPDMARWLSSDPIEEKGGINTYQFVFNSAVSFVDVLGLMLVNPNGINCLGYACGREDSIQPDLMTHGKPRHDSLKDVVEQAGYTCKGPTKEQCKCDCGEDSMVVYVYREPLLITLPSMS